MLHGQVAGRAVMAWNVPFHAARNPRPNHTDQRGLDFRLAIDVVVATLL
jgi:hypothetical protein